MLTNKGSLFGNILWLLADKAYGSLLVLGFLALFARQYGPEVFGIWNYIVAFGALVPALGSLGLNFLIVQYLKEKPALKDAILAHALLLRFLFSLGFVLILGLGYYALGINGEYIWVALTYFLSQLVLTANVAIYENESKLENQKTVIARNIAFTLGFIARLIAIGRGEELLIYALISLAEMSLFFLLLGRKSDLFSALKGTRFSGRLSKILVTRGMPLFLSAITVILYLRIDQVFIGHFMDNQSVGIYASASRITEMFYALPVIITNVFFPKVIEAKRNKEDFKKSLAKMYGVVLWLSLLICLGIILVSDHLVVWLYGPEFIESAEILRMYAWSLLFMGILVSGSKFILTISANELIFKRDVLGLVSNVVLNVVLIPQFGLKGAAMATLISYFISAYLSNIFFKKLRPLLVEIPMGMISILSLVKRRGIN